MQKVLITPTTLKSKRISGSKPPPRLSDDEFWRLITSVSEPPGTFRHSENLVSNEELFAHTIRMLGSRGGVYVGVGPEQNFSYIVRVRPAMAFIVDVRQENRNLHLLYKALFELSESRVEFVSKLFSRAITAEFDADVGRRYTLSAFRKRVQENERSKSTRRTLDETPRAALFSCVAPEALEGPDTWSGT